MNETTRVRRAKLEDVAREAGVGIATVDRVLNERGNVSAKTSARVLAAAKALNLRRVLPDTRHRVLRIEALLARPNLTLIRRMGEEFARIARRLDRSVQIQRTALATDAPELMAERIRASRADGVVVYAQAHPEIHAAIDAVTARGKAVVTMISDLPGSARIAYAGIDHAAAGRTAAFFLGGMARAPGPVILLCHHFGFQSHGDRARAFGEALRRHGPHLTLGEIVEGRDDVDLSERLLRPAVRRHPDLAGIYNVGSANRAVAAVIRAGLVARPPLFVGHELTPHSQPMLREGVMSLAIDQNTEQQAQFAIDVLMHHFGHTEMPGLAPPYTSPVPFALHTPENPGPPRLAAL